MWPNDEGINYKGTAVAIITLMVAKRLSVTKYNMAA